MLPLGNGWAFLFYPNGTFFLLVMKTILSSKKTIGLFICLIIFCVHLNGQQIPARFEAQTIRIDGDSNIKVDTSVNIIIADNTLRGVLIISIYQGKEYTYGVPDSSKYNLGDSRNILKFKSFFTARFSG
jgi:hypothetical protein